MFRRHLLALGTAAAAPLLPGTARAAPPGYRVTYFNARTEGSGRVGSRDVTAAGDGSIWFRGQRNGTLNRLDPRDGAIRVVSLGRGGAPHGVIRGPDGAAWVGGNGTRDAAARRAVVKFLMAP